MKKFTEKMEERNSIIKNARISLAEQSKCLVSNLRLFDELRKKLKTKKSNDLLNEIEVAYHNGMALLDHI